jgi:hypothetical protein
MYAQVKRTQRVWGKQPEQPFTYIHTYIGTGTLLSPSIEKIYSLVVQP